MKPKVLNVEKLVYKGLGLGLLNGKVVLVPFAAPGDVLEIEVTASKTGYMLGAIKKILQPASCRTMPLCRYFGRCGGCHLQHINYAAELLWKQIIVEEQLKRIGKLGDVSVNPTIPSPRVWGYRNRLELHVRGGIVGLVDTTGREIVDIERCSIADDIVNSEIAAIRRETRLAKGRNGRILVSSEASEVFAQTNNYVNEILKQRIAHIVQLIKARDIVELYAGTGNLTFAIAGMVERIVAVERDGRAVKIGQINAAERGIKNATFVTADAADYLKTAKASFELVLADPPRGGMGRKVVDEIGLLAPKHIIYISCNPSTLARDGALITRYGYRHVFTEPIDMFPRTYHIESITLFSSTESLSPLP